MTIPEVFFDEVSSLANPGNLHISRQWHWDASENIMPLKQGIS
jgi:hypothetical protein